MNISSMCQIIRDMTYTDIDDYPNLRIVSFINLVKDDFWSHLITGVGAKTNWDTWTIDNTVANQSEYRIPEAATDTEGNLKINGVSVCYNGQSYSNGLKKYKKCREVSPENLSEHWNYYISNQSESDPIYYTADRSVFIAPAFDSVISEGIQIEGIKSITDYDENTTEAQMKIPSFLHNHIIQGTLPYIHRSQGKKTEAFAEEKKYEEGKNEASQKIANRSSGPSFMTYPEYNDHDDDYTLRLD